MSKHKDQYVNQNTSQNLTQLGLNEEEKYDSMKSKSNRTSFEFNFQQQEMNEATYIESKRQRPKIEE
ncbi:unnamed protein product [Moneuplotes crassus]|uniref:Uncharacterized protein n=1 Tax=Euplotes crassus TaxID=5936 RepID=A0AAD1UHQ6_EUPCR|nr:unnamed protein product [Moneuplotes crassus]